MARIDLDFIAKRPRYRLAGGILLLVGALWLTLLSQMGQQRELEIAGLQAALDKLAKPKAVKVDARPVDEHEQAGITSTRQQLKLDWESLFQALEQANFKGVALLTVQPEAQKKQLRLNGEALSEEDLHDYLRRLQQTNTLREAVLTSQILDERDPQQKVIRFQISAHWEVK